MASVTLSGWIEIALFLTVLTALTPVTVTGPPRPASFGEPLHDRPLRLLPGVDLRIVADRRGVSEP